MNKARIAILSSVKPRCFASIDFDKWFNQNEKTSALKNEVDVWKDALSLDYLRENTSFEVINVLNWVPKRGDYDWYILGWSPSMVTEKLPWMIDLQKFIYDEINSWKTALWVCFWHQIMASSFWWKVEYAKKRNLWAWKVFLNANWMWDEIFWQMHSHFDAIWSHKQYVSNAWEWESLWDNNHTPNQIIRYWDNAWGVQFHPEFSKEFTSFLVKLMSSDLKNESIDVEKTLKKLNKMMWNESSKVITLFLQRIIKGQK